MRLVQKEYVSTRHGKEFDDILFSVNNEVRGGDFVRFECGPSGRWRSTEETIEYLEWIIEEVRVLQFELGIKEKHE